MRNKSVSDFVASTMDAVLKSAEHKSLFGTQYKFASSDSMCAEHGKMDSCSADDQASADDNDAKKKKEESESSSSSSDSSSADDSFDADDNDAKKKKMPPWLQKKEEDSSSAEDGSEMSASAALNVAIDSLLTASAALDSVGMGNSSTLSLKLANLVVTAKKKMTEKDSQSAKDKMAKQKAKEKEAKDKQSAKDKMVKEKEKLAKEKAKEKEAKDKQSAKDKMDKEKAKEKAAKELALKKK